MRVRVDDGVELAVTVHGAGPPLLCVHGFGGAKEDFADHLERLGTRARVVLVDLRGHGDSGGPADPAAYSLDRCAADLWAVADALGLGRVRLLGHSMGGMVVRRMAVTAPDRVDAVVFESTAAGPPRGLDPDLVDLGAALALEDFAALKAVLDEARVLGTPAYERLLADRPGFTDYVDAKWARLVPAMWSALAPAIAREPDATHEVRAIACPVLVIVGALDAVFLDASTAIAAAAPDARLAVVADAGHHPHFENPEAWFVALATFLDGLAEPEGADPS
ncbi:MAG: alpha/beta fold hydrolase [Actinomycetota bacterium]